MVSFGRAVRRGQMAFISDDVFTLTGEQPRSLHGVIQDKLSGHVEQ